MNHIELFAGCGGLSLGMAKAGFEKILANELSPMAAETFAYNFFNEDFHLKSLNKEKNENALWISSQYSDLGKRLRENPFEYPELGKGYSDIPKDTSKVSGKLLVGNIIHLNQLIKSSPELLNSIKTGFGRGGVDLVSGGPPCQSFSMAGMRKKDCDKNILPWEFANFVEKVQPKFAMLENVTGILRAFKEDGKSYHAWFEVAKVFASKGYVPLCLHINARLVGIPQNRPRFIMIAPRYDVYQKLKDSFNSKESELFAVSEGLYTAIQKQNEYVFEDFKYFDATKSNDQDYFVDTFLSVLLNHKEVSVKDAINDLAFSSTNAKSDFINELNENFSEFLTPKGTLPNHAKRANGEHVRRRFRIYQILQDCGRPITLDVFNIFKQKAVSLPTDSWDTLKEYEYLIENNSYKQFADKVEFENYLLAHATKKQTQKALNANAPAPAALSIPDDACHYDKEELRTLTVREMARIQSFPDDFEFRSKVTTGGKMRRFEVPQYTQVGNAVPPLLGAALGYSIKDLLSRT